MAEPDKVLVNILGPIITTAIGAAIGWLPGGLVGIKPPALTALIAAGGAICGFMFSLMYKRYLGVLGAGGSRTGSPGRDAYNRLRASLSAPNQASRLYADRLTKFLDAVDRFFGDAGMADRTLCPHAFGLMTPAPLWTAAALDRCLLLALIYPVASIYVIWAMSGHIGPAEAALGLKADLAGWRRALSVGSAGISIFVFVQFLRVQSLDGAQHKTTVLAIAGAGTLAVALTGTVALAGVVALTLAGTIAAVSGLLKAGGFSNHYARALALAGALSVAVAVGDGSAGTLSLALAAALAGTIAIAGAVAVVGVCAVAVALAGDVPGVGEGSITAALLAGVVVASIIAVTLGIYTLNSIAIARSRQGAFLSLFLAGMILICLCLPTVLAPLSHWKIFSGPVLSLLVLLTLINAPFDWAALGLTRALLRRGLELGGWWPYFLALVDALLAAGIIVFLSIAIVVSIQAFDHLAEFSNGPDKRVLPLAPLFDGIAANPGAPEYWWVYALLLSTTIPSLVNLMIGGASLLRGVPGASALLLQFMPIGKAVAPFDRQWIALTLTVQVFAGAFLGIIVQAFVAIALIFYIMPWFGLELLDIARGVAECDLPMRAIGWFLGRAFPPSI